MQALSTISNSTELVQHSSDKMSLTRPSGISSSDGMATALLMRQTSSRYTNQVITEPTKEMHLAEWEEMVIKYGLQPFRDALSKVIRASRFFPDPQDLWEACREPARVARTERDATETQELLRKQDAARELCRKERAEELASGWQPSEQEVRLNAMLKAKGRAPQSHAPQHVPTAEECMAMLARRDARQAT